MITITRSNSYFFINSPISQELHDSLDEVLSYYKEGYEKTDAFQSGKWNGKEQLLRRAKNGSFYFPFGLLDKVCQVLRIWGLEYEIVDDVCPIAPIPDNYGDDESISLRPYQRDALNQLATRCFNSSGILALPTAAGKTSCALFYAKYLNLPFIVLVHRVELLRQWRDEIKEKLGIDATLIGAGEDRTGDGRATVAMVQTLANRDERYDTGLLIADELHTIAAKTFYPVAMKINAKYRLGLSATPTRSDGAELKIFACCGCIASVISVEDLVKDGYLAVPEFHMVNLPSCRVPYSSTWQTVYKQGIVLNMERNEKIAEIAKAYLNEGRQVYIHVNQVSHGHILEGMIEESVFVHGATKKGERDDIIKRFKNGDIRCLISTLLREGVSIDGISCLILASAGKSPIALIQTVGRALRVDPEFKNAIIIDFIDRGHRMLENHTQERILTFRSVYGDLFNY